MKRVLIVALLLAVCTGCKPTTVQRSLALNKRGEALLTETIKLQQDELTEYSAMTKELAEGSPYAAVEPKHRAKW